MASFLQTMALLILIPLRPDLCLDLVPNIIESKKNNWDEAINRNAYSFITFTYSAVDIELPGKHEYIYI